MRHFQAVPLFLVTLFVAIGCASTRADESNAQETLRQPNFVFVFVDDLRYDAPGENSAMTQMPNVDALAARGVTFNQAFAVLSVCSPSRATVLTGRYPFSHGVTTYGNTPLKPGNPSFIHAFKSAGYSTAINGKWHLGTTPEQAGFDWADTFEANGTWYGRKAIQQGETIRIEKYIEEWIADRSIAFIEQSVEQGKPFFLWHCTQVPHMTSNFDWPARPPAMELYDPADITLPASYPPDHDATGKPPYLRDSRSYTKAMEEYGYQTPAKLRTHIHKYLASVSEMDAEVGRVFDRLEELGLADNTYVVFLSDNGWQLGEHGLTSKVLMYDKSMKVPLVIAGPGIERGASNQLVHNGDMAPTLMELAGIAPDDYHFHGKSFVKMLRGRQVEWRDAVYYESPTPQLIPRSFYGLRTDRYVYIETFSKQDPTKREFTELYDLRNDPDELNNLALDPANAKRVEAFRKQLQAKRKQYGSL